MLRGMKGIKEGEGKKRGTVNAAEGKKRKGEENAS